MRCDRLTHWVKWFLLHLMCCNHLSFSMSCSSHPYVFNICLAFTFIKFATWCLWPSWTIFTDVTSLQIAKACGLTQPLFVVTTEVCPNIVIKIMSILLTIMETISCIIIPIIRVAIVSYICFLVWWPHGFRSTFKSFISILLIVVTISFKSLCVYGSSSAFMCLMTLLVAHMEVNHVLRHSILIYSLALI